MRRHACQRSLAVCVLPQHGISLHLTNRCSRRLAVRSMPALLKSTEQSQERVRRRERTGPADGGSRAMPGLLSAGGVQGWAGAGARVGRQANFTTS